MDNNTIYIHEVGMRDGLQVEREIVPFEKKVEWINKLMDCSIDIIQIGSFVHPVKVPTMCDTDALFEYFSKSKGKHKNVILSGLVLNEKGLERGLKCGVEMFCMGVSASETHSRKNTGMSTDEAIVRITAMAKTALDSGKKVQASVQSAFGCGFEGKISEDRVLQIIDAFVSDGIENVSLADTAGHAYPYQVENIVSMIMEKFPFINLICHFHDTFGMGIANCYTSYKLGIKYFESAFGGLGGCPFTAKASGNVCTEDLVYMFHKMGIRNDINLKNLIKLSKEAEIFFKRELPGSIYRIGIPNYN